MIAVSEQAEAGVDNRPADDLERQVRAELDNAVDSHRRGSKVYQSLRDLNEVIREVNRDLRDKGQYDLYIAYPFVEGRLPGEDFDIRCPLALFPVILEKDQRSVTLSRDDTRDPVYNNSLITAFMKFNGRSTSLPHNVIEDPRAALRATAELCGLPAHEKPLPPLGDDRNCAEPYREVMAAALRD